MNKLSAISDNQKVVLMGEETKLSELRKYLGNEIIDAIIQTNNAKSIITTADMRYFVEVWGDGLIKQNKFASYENLVTRWNNLIKSVSAKYDQLETYLDLCQESSLSCIDKQRLRHTLPMDNKISACINKKTTEFRKEDTLKKSLRRELEDWDNSYQIEEERGLSHGGKCDLYMRSETSKDIILELKKSKIKTADVYQTFNYGKGLNVDTALIAHVNREEDIKLAKSLGVSVYNIIMLREKGEEYPAWYTLEKVCGSVNTLDLILGEMRECGCDIFTIPYIQRKEVCFYLNMYQQVRNTILHFANRASKFAEKVRDAS